MTRLLRALAPALALLAAACAYPVSTVGQGGAVSGVYFPGAPQDALVSIDGAAGQDAATFTDAARLLAL